MNKEINLRMDFLLKEIKGSSLDETFFLKLKAIVKLMSAETSRVDQGGEPDKKACLTFARILDGFSAHLLELGMPENLCESFNSVANSIRKSYLERFE
jgi:hypothetical protein